MAVAGHAVAQELETAAEAQQAPAHISVVDGVAILERDGEIDDSPLNMPLLAGDRVRTRAGRVEILFTDGSTLHLDHNSTIDLQSDDLLRLVEGRVRLSIPGPDRDVAYRIDGPQGWVQIAEPGDYRVALLNGPRGSELELAVLRGRAELANDDGQTALRAGERAFARAGVAPSYAYVFNSAAWDAFDRWSEARRDARLDASAEYLPDEVRAYSASFEQYGYWQYEPTYGRVWYPRVASDWRPYYRGRWVRLRPYGWTWVAHDPWGWPTHHYGRWGYSTAGWFWIPGRTWGAAWVSWAYAPGYVSWCPLGWNNRPVFQINIGRGYDPWRAWTVIPQGYFGVGYVHRYVVRVDRLDYRSRAAFTHRAQAPDVGGRAVPRGSMPIRAAGTRDHRRGASPVYTNVPADRARVRGDGQRVTVPDAREPRRAGVPSGARVRSSDERASTPGAGQRAVGRERAIPQQPAVRSERPAVEYRRPPGDAGVRESPRYGATPARPRMSEPRMGDRTPTGRERPSGVPRAVPRDSAPRESAPPPAPVYSAPSYGRPAEVQRPSRGGLSAPSDAGRGMRAAPRGESVRPPAGSNERRAPAAAQPPPRGSEGSGGRPSAPPRGARPRPGGGGESRNR